MLQAADLYGSSQINKTLQSIKQVIMHVSFLHIYDIKQLNKPVRDHLYYNQTAIF